MMIPMLYYDDTEYSTKENSAACNDVDISSTKKKSG